MKLILVVFFREEEDSGLLECLPLSKWDPNEQKDLEVIQEGDEGEVRGLVVKNSKWVCILIKISVELWVFLLLSTKINVWLCFIFLNKTVLML